MVGPGVAVVTWAVPRRPRSPRIEGARAFGNRGRRSRVAIPTISGDILGPALERVGRPYVVVRRPGGLGLAEAEDRRAPGAVAGYLPACRPEALGDSSFRDDHGLRFAYVSGAMANGIGSVEIAEAMGRAGMLG